MSLDAVRALDNAEIVEWRAFYTYERAQQQFALDVAKARRGRG